MPAFPRTAAETLLHLSREFPVVAVSGPLHSGVSVLVHGVFPYKPVVPLEKPSTLEIARSSPRDFLCAYPEGAILEDAHLVPGLPEALVWEAEVNGSPPGKFIVTASKALPFPAGSSTAAAASDASAASDAPAAAAELHLLPLSVPELLAGSACPRLPWDLMLQGSWPELYREEEPPSREEWMSQFLQEHLEKNLLDRVHVSHMESFLLFLIACAGHTGELLSYRVLASEAGVSPPTARTWLSALLDSLLVFLLPPGGSCPGKTCAKTPKLYFTDTGLLCRLLRLNSTPELLLSPKKGTVAENFAILELQKLRLNQGLSPSLSFFQDAKGFGTDLLADWDQKLAFSIARSSDPPAAQMKKLKRFLSSSQDSGLTGVMLHLGEGTYWQDGILWAGWKEWNQIPSRLQQASAPQDVR